MNKKYLQMVALVCIELIIFMPMSFVAALQIVHEPNPSRVINETSAEIQWQTDEDATAIVDYGTTQQLGQKQTRIEYDKLHQVTLYNLTPNVRYYFQLMSITAAGEYQLDNNNEQFYSFLTKPESDIIAPEITSVELISITATTATIRWQTDETATSIIYVGKEGEPLNITNEFPELVSDHIITAPAVDGVKYNYIVSSCDRMNNCRNSTQYFFIGGADVTPPEINVELSEWHLSGRIDITGTTEAYAVVNLYVNGQNVRRLQSHQTGDGGIINFQNVALPSGENNITISATDQVGNNASRDYVVKIDPIPPTLRVSGVPAITNDVSATLTVNISEPCTVIFDVKTSDETAPGKVVGIKEKSRASIMLEIEWDDNTESDFEEYAIYRLLDEDGEEWVRIGTSTNNNFRDTKVAPGKAYSYRISAVDKNCNEGAQSDSLRIEVPEGGGVSSQALQITPAELTCETEFDSVTHDGGTFQHLISFEEGLNLITVTAIDRGGHTVVYRNQTIYDLNPPEFLITNLDDINPTYVPTVTVSGNVSEKAIVKIYVNDEKFDEIETDDKGYFAVPVELSREDPVSESQRHEISVHLPMLSLLFGDDFDIGSVGPIWLNTIKLVAVDMSGSESQPEEQTVVYTTCGLGSWYNVDIGGESGSVFGTGGMTPEILNPRLMIEGNEMISIPINLTYIGGYNATLMGPPTVRIASLSLEEEENYDIDWVTVLDPICDIRTQQTCLVQIQVSVPSDYFDELEDENDNVTMFLKEEKLGNHRKEDCIISAAGCIKVPMLMDITFKEIRPRTGPAQEGEYPGQPRVETKVQKKCWNLEIGIDQRVDPDIIPEELLELATGTLDAALNAIEAVLEPINTIKEYVFYACTGMWIVQFIYGIYANFQCGTVDVEDSVVAAASELFKFAAGGKYDVKIAEMGLCETEYPKGDDNTKDSYENCINCQDSIETRADLDWTMRQFCDRIFCPSAPTFQKYIKDQASKKKPKIVVGPYTKQEYKYGSSCGCAFTGSGEDCDPVENKNQVATGFEAVKQYYEWYKQEDQKSADAATGLELCEGPHTAKPRCCGVEYMEQWGSACGLPFADDTLFSEIGESVCLGGEAANQNATITGLDFGGGSGADSLTCHRTFNSVVGFCDPEGKEELDMVSTHRKLSKSVKNEFSFDKENDELFVCLKPNFKDGDDENIYNYDISFCFPTTDTSIRKNQSNAKDEDIFSIQKDTVLYSPPDWTSLTSMFGDESKQEAGKKSFCDEMNKKVVQPDQTACRAVYDEVQNKIGSPDKQYIVDPTSGWIRAFQCICLSAITAYLKLWQRALTAINNCFKTILLTGDGSAGMCQAVLSTYICDLIFELIQCFSSKYSSGPSRGGFDVGFGDFSGALTKAGSDISDSVAGRYGDSSMWQAMFVDQKIVHAICLWIFTGTWDIDISVLLDAGESGIVTDTIGLLYPCERRFRGFNPVTTPEGLTNWNYHFGVGMIPGADLTYTLKLICNDGFSCTSSEYENGRCDCRDGKEELVVMDQALPGTISSTGTLDEEIFFDIQNTGKRYDKAILEWSWTDNNGDMQTDKAECEVNQVGGSAPAFCNFDIAHGVFRCSLGFELENWARFNAISATYPFGQPAFKLGDPMQFVIDVQQAVPTNPECTTENCDYTKYLMGTIYTPSGAVFWSSSEAKQLNTRGQSLITDFVPPSVIINSKIKFNEEMQRTQPTSFAKPCMGGNHDTVSVSRCQGRVSDCATLCSGGLGLRFDGLNKEKENYVLAIDKRVNSYKIFIPTSIEQTTGVDQDSAGIEKNFYKEKELIYEGLINPGEGKTRDTINFKNGELRAILVGQPIANYAEIVYTAGTVKLTSTVGVDACSRNENFAEASANKWRAEFKILPSKQFGNRYQPDYDSLEQYVGYDNPITKDFIVICNERIESASGQAAPGECSLRSMMPEPTPCWCSQESRIAARIPGGAEVTPFDCEKGQFCVDYKCGDVRACDIVNTSKANVADCICAFDGASPIICKDGKTCYYDEKKCWPPQCEKNVDLTNECFCTASETCDLSAGEKVCCSDGTCVADKSQCPMTEGPNLTSIFFGTTDLKKSNFVASANPGEKITIKIKANSPKGQLKLSVTPPIGFTDFDMITNKLIQSDQEEILKEFTIPDLAAGKEYKIKIILTDKDNDNLKTTKEITLNVGGTKDSPIVRLQKIESVIDSYVKEIKLIDAGYYVIENSNEKKHIYSLQAGNFDKNFKIKATTIGLAGGDKELKITCIPNPVNVGKDNNLRIYECSIDLDNSMINNKFDMTLQVLDLVNNNLFSPLLRIPVKIIKEPVFKKFFVNNKEYVSGASVEKGDTIKMEYESDYPVVHDVAIFYENSAGTKEGPVHTSEKGQGKVFSIEHKLNIDPGNYKIIYYIGGKIFFPLDKNKRIEVKPADAAKPEIVSIIINEKEKQDVNEIEKDSDLRIQVHAKDNSFVMQVNVLKDGSPVDNIDWARPDKREDGIWKTILEKNEYTAGKYKIQIIDDENNKVESAEFTIKFVDDTTRTEPESVPGIADFTVKDYTCEKFDDLSDYKTWYLSLNDIRPIEFYAEESKDGWRFYKVNIWDVEDGKWTKKLMKIHKSGALKYVGITDIITGLSPSYYCENDMFKYMEIQSTGKVDNAEFIGYHLSMFGENVDPKTGEVLPGDTFLDRLQKIEKETVRPEVLEEIKHIFSNDENLGKTYKKGDIREFWYGLHTRFDNYELNYYDIGYIEIEDFLGRTQDGYRFYTIKYNDKKDGIIRIREKTGNVQNQVAVYWGTLAKKPLWQLVYTYEFQWLEMDGVDEVFGGDPILDADYMDYFGYGYNEPTYSGESAAEGGLYPKNTLLEQAREVDKKYNIPELPAYRKDKNKYAWSDAFGYAASSLDWGNTDWPYEFERKRNEIAGFHITKFLGRNEHWRFYMGTDNNGKRIIISVDEKDEDTNVRIAYGAVGAKGWDLTIAIPFLLYNDNFAYIQITDSSLILADDRLEGSDLDDFGTLWAEAKAAETNAGIPEHCRLFSCEEKKYNGDDTLSAGDSCSYDSACKI